MLLLIRNAKLADRLNTNEIGKLTCVISEDDNLIEDKIKQEFQESKSSHKLETVRLKRARRVGQSYLTALWSTFIGLLSSIRLILSHRPHLCLTNGPAISVTASIAIRCLNFASFYRYRCEIIYVESFCRTRTLSLSGKIIYHCRLANKFYVQWPALASCYKRAVFKGLLV